MRRLIALVSAMGFLEVLFFSALAPLLPSLEHDLDLSRAQSGLLVAVFAVGVMIVTIPAALLSARLGVKLTAIGGLVTLGAASVAFGVAQSYEALVAARLMQGAGAAAVLVGAMVWLIDAVPREQRGEMIGVALGVMAAGHIAGPLLGGIATVAGRAPTFAGTAAVAAVLCLVALSSPAPVREHRSLRIRAALRSGGVRTGMWLTSVPALLWGAVAVLAPFHLHGLGSSPGAIAATFGAAAAAGVLVRPLSGRWSDRQGRLRPIRFALLVSMIMLIAMAWAQNRWAASLLLVVALVTIGLCWAPTMALLSDECQVLGVSQVVATTMTNLAWTPASILGSAGGGAMAGAIGQPWAYVVLAAVAFGTLLMLTRRDEPCPAQAPA